MIFGQCFVSDLDLLLQMLKNLCSSAYQVTYRGLQFGRSTSVGFCLECCTQQKLPIVCIIVSAYQAKGASPCKIGSLAEILTSIHCLKPATSVSDCMGCCTLQDLPFVCGCAYQAKGTSPCKMVLWSRSRLVGVCSYSFPFNKAKFNPTRQPAVISNHWFHIFCFLS